jgi:hypothetical protein
MLHLVFERARPNDLVSQYKGGEFIFCTLNGDIIQLNKSVHFSALAPVVHATGTTGFVTPGEILSKRIAHGA